MKNAFRIALAALVLLASQAAIALGLGQMRVKSGLGEPLLAEIPIVSSVPGELERLHVGLASPETFARIGLEPPRGVVADLRFNLALGDDGRPVVRVTSSQPIEEPVLNFLVEVDWGQGRLVREYSALVDAPRTVSAPLAPPVEAPVAAPSNTIIRPPAEPVPARPESGEEARAAGEQDAAATAAADPAAGDATAEDPPMAAPPPAPAAVASPSPSMPAQGRPGELRVQAGDTLSEIARDLGFQASLEQAMVALLRSNPGAFIDGNVHMVRSGALLRVPGEADVAAVDAAQALAQVRDQTRAWRQATQAVAQPETGAADEAANAVAEADPAAGSSAEQDPAAPATDARLEIVPPGASDATAAGDRSGISDGGEGDTMRQQLQQANEALAAREAELEEIKSRLAELEEIQADQQQLIEMKDNELASVQAELAQAREQGGAPADAGVAGWWIGGGVLLALVLLGAWLLQRRADQAPRFRAPPPRTEPASPPAPGSMAAAFPPPASAPAGVSSGSGAVAGAAVPWAAPAEAEPAGAPASPLPPEPAIAAAPDEVQEDATEETQEPGGPVALEAKPELHPEPEPEPEQEPPVPTTGAPDSPASRHAPDEGAVPGNERLELARAFVQLGDSESARQLLTELVVNGDLAARQEATRMLRELD
ncbi:FimV/HubP family polar landmark protein [Novilysobacter defluvii]|uniref:FimV/HubP family polar landmark protein n=2 Tax=Novilysobacter defluvii TaxID=391738 RepID=UPI000411FDC8|nr:FimV/HubP family polar landmark protein [Lysobacter defluvii]